MEWKNWNARDRLYDVSRCKLYFFESPCDRKLLTDEALRTTPWVQSPGRRCCLAIVGFPSSDLLDRSSPIANRNMQHSRFTWSRVCKFSTFWKAALMSHIWFRYPFQRQLVIDCSGPYGLKRIEEAFQILRTESTDGRKIIIKLWCLAKQLV